MTSLLPSAIGSTLCGIVNKTFYALPKQPPKTLLHISWNILSLVSILSYPACRINNHSDHITVAPGIDVDARMVMENNRLPLEIARSWANVSMGNDF